jgi:hypothetical protein
LSGETLTASNRRTVGQGFQRALKALWSMGVQGESEVFPDHGGFGGSLEALPNGDGTATRSLVHKGSMPMMHHKRAYLKILHRNI